MPLTKTMLETGTHPDLEMSRCTRKKHACPFWVAAIFLAIFLIATVAAIAVANGPVETGAQGRSFELAHAHRMMEEETDGSEPEIRESQNKATVHELGISELAMSVSQKVQEDESQVAMGNPLTANAELHKNMLVWNLLLVLQITIVIIFVLILANFILGMRTPNGHNSPQDVQLFSASAECCSDLLKALASGATFEVLRTFDAAYDGYAGSRFKLQKGQVGKVDYIDAEKGLVVHVDGRKVYIFKHNFNDLNFNDLKVLQEAPTGNRGGSQTGGRQTGGQQVHNEVALTDNAHMFELKKFEGVWESLSHEVYEYEKNDDGEYILKGNEDEGNKNKLMDKLHEFMGFTLEERFGAQKSRYGDGLMVQRVKMVTKHGSLGFEFEFKLKRFRPYKVINYLPIKDLQANPELRFVQLAYGFTDIWTGTGYTAMRRKNSEGNEPWDKSLADHGSLIIDDYDREFLQARGSRKEVNGDMKRRFIYIQRDEVLRQDVLFLEDTLKYREDNKEKQLKVRYKFIASTFNDEGFDSLQGALINSSNTWSYADDKISKMNPDKERNMGPW